MFNFIKLMGMSDYLERYFSEITVLRAFEAGAFDYLSNELFCYRVSTRSEA
jgi:hypothetical protein